MVLQHNGDGVSGRRIGMIWAKQDDSVVAGYCMNSVLVVYLEQLHCGSMVGYVVGKMTQGCGPGRNMNCTVLALAGVIASLIDWGCR